MKSPKEVVSELKANAVSVDGSENSQCVLIDRLLFTSSMVVLEQVQDATVKAYHRLEDAYKACIDNVSATEVIHDTCAMQAEKISRMQAENDELVDIVKDGNETIKAGEGIHKHFVDNSNQDAEKIRRMQTIIDDYEGLAERQAIKVDELEARIADGNASRCLVRYLDKALNTILGGN